jgi:putative flavoprotein involved in K+ transport
MHYDVIVIGGGQSALACGYYLRRTGLNYVLLDANQEPGGAWLHAWDSLTLFSPAEHSSLPGWMMPPSKEEFPSRDEVIDYLTEYERRYEIPVQRGVEVKAVTKEGAVFKLETSAGQFTTTNVISATGSYRKPFIPNVKGREYFLGKQLHSSLYKNPAAFKDKQVLIVGEGNSGAQVLAELSKVATCYWATQKDPEFLPDDVDGRVLFDSASAMYYAKKQGITLDVKKLNLGNIVMVPPVKEARDRGVLISSGQLKAFTPNEVVWSDERKTHIDAVIWCTGFGFATEHLQNLVDVDERGRAKTENTRSTEVEGLYFVGYGNWTGFASATLIGVGRSARETIKEIQG